MVNQNLLQFQNYTSISFQSPCLIFQTIIKA
ncbi:uncharacterized protein METZ01_LOCUS313666, partial [marine metagenome]